MRRFPRKTPRGTIRPTTETLSGMPSKVPGRGVSTGEPRGVPFGRNTERWPARCATRRTKNRGPPFHGDAGLRGVPPGRMERTPWPLSRPHARAAPPAVPYRAGPGAGTSRGGAAASCVDPHAGQMGPTCEKCHDAEAGRWRVRPDVGARPDAVPPSVGTWLCHAEAVPRARGGGRLPRAPAGVFGCHEDNLRRRAEPRDLALPRDCERCHRTDDFKT